MSAKFNELKRDSERYMERDDCLVKAVAVVCDLDYEHAHRALATNKVRHWRKFTSDDWQKATWLALHTLGFNVAPVLPCPASSVAAFERLNLPGRYLLCRARRAAHITGAING